MLSVINILTFLWLVFFALRSLGAMSRGDRRSIHFPIMVLCLFCGLPLLLDELIGQPEYLVFPGFYWATRDIITNYIYCAYMALVPVFWLFLSRISNYNFTAFLPSITANTYQPAPIRKLGSYSKLILSLLLISPLIAVAVSPNPLLYLDFSTVMRAQVSDIFLVGHKNVALFANFSTMAAAVFIATAKPRIFGTIPYISVLLMPIAFIIVSVWLQGKRSLVAMATVFLILAFHYRGVLRGKKLFIAIGIALVVTLTYSFFFQIYSDRISRTMYENFRVDYGRDDVIKMTIYSEMNPQSIQILEHRGQSMLFYATFFIPRGIWSEKPMPYAQYFTSGIFGTKPRFWGWSMTTSWLEEAIANFGMAGFIFGPLIIWIVCYVGDSRQSVIIQLITPLFASLLIVVQAIAFMPIIALWLLLLIRKKRKRRLMPLRQVVVK
jgi:hypothetical protein